MERYALGADDPTGGEFFKIEPGNAAKNAAGEIRVNQIF